jgi:hypothetical protein
MVHVDEILPMSTNGERRAPSAEELALVDVGCSVWALNLEADTDAEASEIKGGVVFAVETAADPETGELQRRFITATPWRRQIRFDVVLADEVRQVAAPNTSVMKSLLRRAASVVAESGKRMSTDVTRCITLQQKLMEVL